MLVTNNTKSPLALNASTPLPPGVPTPVHNWEQLKKNAVVAAWLKAGVLREGDDAPDAKNSKLLPPDGNKGSGKKVAAKKAPAKKADGKGGAKAELAAQLTALGIKFHPNTGEAKLQALLDEAKAKKAAEEKA